MLSTANASNSSVAVLSFGTANDLATVCRIPIGDPLATLRLAVSPLPHFTTLKKFSERSNVLAVIDAMLLEVARESAPEDDTESAIDSTETEKTAAVMPQPLHESENAPSQ